MEGRSSIRPSHTPDSERPDEEGEQENGGGRLSRIFTYIVTGYAITVFALWLVQWILSEEIPVIGMIKSAIHLLLILSVFLLLLCLLLRRWRLSLILLPALIAFVISYGVFFLPRSREVSASVPDIRILTFNLQAPDQDHVDSVMEIIREADADIVAVQELSIPAADRFAADLSDLYPYRAFHPRESGHLGQGMMSRYPIRADDYWRDNEARRCARSSTCGARHR